MVVGTNMEGKMLRSGNLFSTTSTQIGPIDIWAQCLAANPSAGLAVKADAKTLADLLMCANRFTQIADRGAAAERKAALIGWRKTIEVSAQGIHAHILPNGNTQSTPFGNLLKSNSCE